MGKVQQDTATNWASRDAYLSWAYAIRMMALRIGSRRFETLPEMYWQEQHGLIP